MEILEKMKSKQAYSAYNDEMPLDFQKTARKLCYEYNQSAPDDETKRKEILKQLLGTYHPLTFIDPIFKVDYGFNVHTSGLTVINSNVVLLDTSPIYLGKNTFIGPNTVLSCVNHALDPELRAKGLLESAPITIEDDVWIGANVTVCQGVTIGKGSTIGAGSVVTKDIPAGVVAVGSPCKVIKKVK